MCSGVVFMLMFALLLPRAIASPSERAVQGIVLGSIWTGPTTRHVDPSIRFYDRFTNPSQWILVKPGLSVVLTKGRVTAIRLIRIDFHAPSALRCAHGFYAGMSYALLHQQWGAPKYVKKYLWASKPVNPDAPASGWIFLIAYPNQRHRFWLDSPKNDLMKGTIEIIEIY